MAPDASNHSLDDDLDELRLITESMKTCTEAEHHDLALRQSVLRARWAPKLSDLPTAKLLEREKQLRILLEEAARGKFDIAASGGSERGNGFDPMQTLKHNLKIDEQNGRAELEAKLTAVLEALEVRAID